MNIERSARELSSKNYSFIESDEWALLRLHPEDWKDFCGSWNRLVADRYMKEGDTFRERRFCKYVVNASEMSFKELDDCGFFQPSAINSYAGDLRREFSPVEPNIRKSRILLEIIKTCLGAILVDCESSAKIWSVYIHQFRINCDITLTGKPTPEGLHRDGHDYISMHLINRSRIEGGESHICTRSGRSLISVTLEDRMDSFLINDRAVLHGVSPITPSTAEPGHRDMLVIDYNRME